MKIERYIDEMVEYFLIPNEQFGNVYLAVEESVNLMFGRMMDPDSRLVIRANRTHRGILITIDARGNPGLCCRDAIDSGIARNAIKRDSYLIKTLADEVWTDESGTCLMLLFVVTGLPLEKALRRTAVVQGYLNPKKIATDVND